MSMNGRKQSQIPSRLLRISHAIKLYYKVVVLDAVSPKVWVIQLPEMEWAAARKNAQDIPCTGLMSSAKILF